MDYVIKVCSMREMIVTLDEYYKKHKNEIKNVSPTGKLPIKVEYMDGTIALFMTENYYEKRYIIGRRRGIDYEFM